MSTPSEPTIQIHAVHTLPSGSLVLTLTVTIESAALTRRIHFADVAGIHQWLTDLRTELAGTASTSATDALSSLMTKPVALSDAITALASTVTAT